MSQRETFLARWARLKRDAVREPEAQPSGEAVAGGAGQPAPELPPLESLDFASDFSAFVQAKVEESVKRAALKKLFQSPHFNQMDGLDVYIDDYNIYEPIPPEMLRKLAHAQDLLFGPAPAAGADAEPEKPAQAAVPDAANEALAGASDAPAGVPQSTAQDALTGQSLSPAPVTPDSGTLRPPGQGAAVAT